MLVPYSYFLFGWGEKGKVGGKYWYRYQYEYRRELGEEEQRWKSQLFEYFAEQTLKNILETGVVENKHAPYSPVTNPRIKVTPEQARAIFYNLAKKQGFKITPLRKNIVHKITENLNENLI